MIPLDCPILSWSDRLRCLLAAVLPLPTTGSECRSENCCSCTRRDAARGSGWPTSLRLLLLFLLLNVVPVSAPRFVNCTKASSESALSGDQGTEAPLPRLEGKYSSSNAAPTLL